jgi:hypothetical protein
MIVVCVRTGDKYPADYVARLRAMVQKHLHHQHKFICFTDRPNDLARFNIAAVDISEMHLKSWWGKMTVFMHGYRKGQRVLYFDLDTVIVNDLSPLVKLKVDLGICANFTRAAGYLDWPCKYGSCIISLGPSLDGDLFKRFWGDRFEIMARAGKYGDQKAIEELAPNAELLQPLLPPSFFLGYRDLLNFKEAPPASCACVIFAGNSKPHNSVNKWVRAAWKL